MDPPEPGRTDAESYPRHPIAEFLSAIKATTPVAGTAGKRQPAGRRLTWFYRYAGAPFPVGVISRDGRPH